MGGIVWSYSSFVVNKAPQTKTGLLEDTSPALDLIDRCLFIFKVIMMMRVVL